MGMDMEIEEMTDSPHVRVGDTYMEELVPGESEVKQPAPPAIPSISDLGRDNVKQPAPPAIPSISDLGRDNVLNSIQWTDRLLLTEESVSVCRVVHLCRSTPGLTINGSGAIETVVTFKPIGFSPDWKYPQLLNARDALENGPLRTLIFGEEEQEQGEMEGEVQI
jgi:hypothetical protein